MVWTLANEIAPIVFEYNKDASGDFSYCVNQQTVKFVVTAKEKAQRIEHIISSLNLNISQQQLLFELPAIDYK